VAATLAQAPAIGYRLMEVHGPKLWSVPAVDAFDLAAFRADLERSGMRCAGLYTPAWGGRDPQEVAEHARAIARCVQYAEALGAHHVTCTGAERRGEPGALDGHRQALGGRREALLRVIDCARQVLAATDPATPVKLTLEPHYGNVLQQPEDFETVLAAVPDPRLGLCVDTGHFHSAGVDTVAFIRRHAERIHAVHFKDHLGATSVGIGRGEIDLAAVVAALREVAYGGGLTIELEVEDPANLPRYTQEAFVYTNGLLGQKL
jgi:sugar phosphate isomerase/epimerase